MPVNLPPNWPILAFGGVVVASVLLFIAAKSVRGLLVVVLGMMVMASLSRHVTWNDKIYQTWLLPIQTYRSELYMGLALALIGGVLVHAGRLRGSRLSMQVMVLWLMGMYSAGMRIVHDGLGEAAISIAVSVLAVLPIALAVQANSHDHASLMRSVRVIVLAGVAWVGATLVQAVISPGLVMISQPPRFIGLSNNPQTTAMMLALWSVVTLWLALNEPVRKARIIWFITLGVFLIFLLGTGSRTGLLMVVTGTTFVAYQRLGAMVLLLPIIAILVFGLLQVASLLGVSLMSERIVSTDNTRAKVWGRLFEAAITHPLVGAGQSKEMGTENSYLQAFAAFGVGMGMLMLLFLATTASLCLRMFKAAKTMHPAYRPFVSLCLGFNAAYLIGGLFEGYILARVSVSLVAMLIIATVSSRVLSWSRMGLIDEHPADEHALDERSDDDLSLIHI